MVINRPWGTYEVLTTNQAFQIKRIVVQPGHQTSLQSHKKRSEHWIILEGIATVTLNTKCHTLKKDMSIFVPKNTRHRLQNEGPTPLTLIEVQTGTYFGEDDIVRYGDDYGRFEKIL